MNLTTLAELNFRYSQSCALVNELKIELESLNKKYVNLQEKMNSEQLQFTDMITTLHSTITRQDITIADFQNAVNEKVFLFAGLIIFIPKKI